MSHSLTSRLSNSSWAICNVLLLHRSAVTQWRLTTVRFKYVVPFWWLSEDICAGYSEVSQQQPQSCEGFSILLNNAVWMFASTLYTHCFTILWKWFALNVPENLLKTFKSSFSLNCEVLTSRLVSHWGLVQRRWMGCDTVWGEFSALNANFNKKKTCAFHH